MEKTLGGNRIGSGAGMKVDLKSYNRSTHDLSYVWRSSQAPGTIVPFMTELALPGDTFDIKLDTLIKTHPTVGPLYGRYRVDLHVFQSPIRLYVAKLHNNATKIGLKMNTVKLPQIRVAANPQKDISDNSQVDASCLLSYLNIRGIGQPSLPGATTVFKRDFNAIPFLAYYDIYKNYYANKQEEKGVIISHVLPQPAPVNEVSVFINSGEPTEQEILITKFPTFPVYPTIVVPNINTKLSITTGSVVELNGNEIVIITDRGNFYVSELFTKVNGSGTTLTTDNIKPQYIGIEILQWANVGDVESPAVEPRLVTFPLENIDEMRNAILSQINSPNAFIIDDQTVYPYGATLDYTGLITACTQNQQGLAIKTYQSDLFNNWLNEEWIDGNNGINAISAIDVSDGELRIDQLIIGRKVFDMMNRIAVSDGTYQSWSETVYDTKFYDKCYQPMFMGGLVKEIVFDEVVSNSATPDQPLGQLAGRGVMSGKHKGGNVYIKVDEASYITGYISLTPMIDYSQGNKWDVNLKTMDDLHKPAMDEIGFQDLITDQMNWADTKVINATSEVIFKSAGKQPSWINYMTNVNQTRGNFAIKENEMFMTLNRRYEMTAVGNAWEIKDLTTYIDPSKFNFIFAETALDAQNFWTQIRIDIKARRVMSARMMPNL